MLTRRSPSSKAVGKVKTDPELIHTREPSERVMSARLPSGTTSRFMRAGFAEAILRPLMRISPEGAHSMLALSEAMCSDCLPEISRISEARAGEASVSVGGRNTPSRAGTTTPAATTAAAASANNWRRSSRRRLHRAR